MAKIDKQLASVSDAQLLADRSAVTAGTAGKGAAPVGKSAPVSAAPTARTATKEPGAWLSWLKVLLAVGAAASLMFWPWPARCGIPILGFTAATSGVALLGVWSAVGTWKHRLGLAHLASLLVTVWALLLGAREVMPRMGYAIPTLERPGQWTCDGLPPMPSAIPNAPAGTTPSVKPNANPAGNPSGGATVSPGVTSSTSPSTAPGK